MLSEKAFNAFLKTLEEPPPHAKFVFATTEIRKVPVTILSRCQRFDLRRVEAETLLAHSPGSARPRASRVEDEALGAIIRAAEGSVRDALSLLDQAIAHGAGAVTARSVRDMLGLADRAPHPRPVRGGDARRRCRRPSRNCAAQYDAGADPSVVIADLAAFTHLVTRLKVVPEAAAADPTLSEVERAAARSSPTSSRSARCRGLGRSCIKAIPEVQAAPRAARGRRDGRSCASPTRPTCRRPTRPCASSRRRRCRRAQPDEHPRPVGAAAAAADPGSARRWPAALARPRPGRCRRSPRPWRSRQR